MLFREVPAAVTVGVLAGVQGMTPRSPALHKSQPRMPAHPSRPCTENQRGSQLGLGCWGHLGKKATGPSSSLPLALAFPPRLRGAFFPRGQAVRTR